MLRNFLDNSIINDDMKHIHSSLRNPERLKHSSFYITGASGMLASYFMYYLIYLNEIHDYGIKIFAGARSREKAIKRFGEYAGKNYFTLITDDVNSEVPLSCPVDYIIHAASPASPQYYGSNPVETILPNVVGTYHLLEYAKYYGIKSFLFFSSGSVYGSMNIPAHENISGTMDFLDSGNSYGEAKRCGEALCHAYYSEYAIPSKSVRIYHSYGPTMDIHTDKRAFSEFVRNVLNGEDIVLKSDGTARRAFCYISDAIAAMYIVLLDGADGEAYNLCNIHEWLSIRELAEIMAGLCPEKGLKVIHGTRDEAGYKLSPERSSDSVDVGKIKALGWSPSVTAEEGFRRTIEGVKLLCH